MIERRFKVVFCLTALIPSVYAISIADAPIWLGLSGWMSSWMLVFLILDATVQERE